MVEASLDESLERCIQTSNIDEARKLRSLFPSEFSKALRTNLIEQAFISACSTMVPETIKQFVDLGVDPNRHYIEGLKPEVSDYTYHYPLNECVRENRWHQVKALLESGADPNLADALASVATLKGESASQMKMAKLLLDNGADINKVRNGFSPLSCALKEGRVELANYLRKKGAIEIEGHESELTLDLSTFQARLEEAITRCWNAVVEKHPKEGFCLFGLETDSDFVILNPLFDSISAIDRDKLNRRKSDSYIGMVSLDSDAEMYGLGKEYFAEIADELNSCYGKPCSDEDEEKRIKALKQIFESSLANLDRAGLFGAPQVREGIILLVSIIDADIDEWKFMLNVAKRLNPELVYQSFAKSLSN